jgi:pyruvate/2-oxoglutarate dehydrogenase complex dihydrolipoamide dehydrogenase (E3) component
MKNAAFFGLPDLTEKADYKKVKAFKDGIIREMSKGLDDKLAESGIKLFRGSARFVSANEVVMFISAQRI